MTAGTGTLLTETVDLRTGHIRARGHLTSLGADLLSGTADSLRGSGHSRVVLDLRGVLDADDAGLDILCALRRTFTEAGGQLLIRHAPGRAARSA
jgi:anti-anti-sigma regulatory factor